MMPTCHVDLLLPKKQHREAGKENAESGHQQGEGSSTNVPLSVAETSKSMLAPTDKLSERFQQIVDAIDESIALVQETHVHITDHK